mmetsp:Transcript_40322/g.125714  ORF Transcript_40322/g.125714 Transcript_40322/m.125714 type:complete len:247 (-) Transcript_40322:240-980(-)
MDQVEVVAVLVSAPVLRQVEGLPLRNRGGLVEAHAGWQSTAVLCSGGLQIDDPRGHIAACAKRIGQGSRGTVHELHEAKLGQAAGAEANEAVVHAVVLYVRNGELAHRGEVVPQALADLIQRVCNDERPWLRGVVLGVALLQLYALGVHQDRLQVADLEEALWEHPLRPADVRSEAAQWISPLQQAQEGSSGYLVEVERVPRPSALHGLPQDRRSTPRPDDLRAEVDVAHHKCRELSRERAQGSLP